MTGRKKPLVVVTRKLPDMVETRMRELFDARLNLDDHPMTSQELAEAMRSADVLVPTVTDRIDATYTNGVLTLRLPVAEKAKPRRVAITSGDTGTESIEAHANERVPAAVGA